MPNIDIRDNLLTPGDTGWVQDMLSKMKKEVAENNPTQHVATAEKTTAETALAASEAADAQAETASLEVAVDGEKKSALDTADEALLKTLQDLAGNVDISSAAIETALESNIMPEHIVRFFTKVSAEAAELSYKELYGKYGKSLTFMVQIALQSMGFDVGTTKIDALYGKNTKDAIALFQASQGLSPDGKAGKKTIAKLLEVATAMRNSETPIDINKKGEREAVVGAYKASNEIATRNKRALNTEKMLATSSEGKKISVLNLQTTSSEGLYSREGKAGKYVFSDNTLYYFDTTIKPWSVQKSNIELGDVWETVTDSDIAKMEKSSYQNIIIHNYDLLRGGNNTFTKKGYNGYYTFGAKENVLYYTPNEKDNSKQKSQYIRYQDWQDIPEKSQEIPQSQQKIIEKYHLKPAYKTAKGNILCYTDNNDGCFIFGKDGTAHMLKEGVGGDARDTISTVGTRVVRERQYHTQDILDAIGDNPVASAKLIEMATAGAGTYDKQLSIVLKHIMTQKNFPLVAAAYERLKFKLNGKGTLFNMLLNETSNGNGQDAYFIQFFEGLLKSNADYAKKIIFEKNQHFPTEIFNNKTFAERRKNNSIGRTVMNGWQKTGGKQSSKNIA